MVKKRNRYEYYDTEDRTPVSVTRKDFQKYVEVLKSKKFNMMVDGETVRKITGISRIVYMKIQNEFLEISKKYLLNVDTLEFLDKPVSLTVRKGFRNDKNF